jgi:hypothetical protein
MLRAATRLEDLKTPPENRLEALKVDQDGQHSIHINEQWHLLGLGRRGWERQGRRNRRLTLKKQHGDDQIDCHQFIRERVVLEEFMEL